MVYPRPVDPALHLELKMRYSAVLLPAVLLAVTVAVLLAVTVAVVHSAVRIFVLSALAVDAR